MATVLLIEDHPDNQDIYRTILVAYGFDVLQAWDGEEGVRLARDSAPDLILMDLSIPRIDGLAATRILKGDAATSGIPIIALTAHALADDRDAAFAAGCDGFISKPAAPRAVVEEVRRHLRAAIAPATGS